MPAEYDDREREEPATERVTDLAPAGSANRPALTVQAKLSVGAADDPYEREADQVADRVVRTLRSGSAAEDGRHASGVSRRIQRASEVGLAGGEVSNDTERLIRSASNGGSPLPATHRSMMEGALGADLSGVRVHTGPQATDLSNRIQAKAFTTGSNIFFRDGLPNAGSASGQRLLAHELTHTMQQGGPQTRRKISKSTTDGTGPIADIADSALSGAVATRATASFRLLKAGTSKSNHPWVKARVAANDGNEPNSVKKYKWGVNHSNREGHLPGVPRGGYTEYYINKVKTVKKVTSASGAATHAERFVVSNSTRDVFHTATHYGRDGSPAFTQYGKL